jgi:hypothetical protein
MVVGVGKEHHDAARRSATMAWRSAHGRRRRAASAGITLNKRAWEFQRHREDAACNTKEERYMVTD